MKKAGNWRGRSIETRTFRATQNPSNPYTNPFQPKCLAPPCKVYPPTSSSPESCAPPTPRPDPLPHSSPFLVCDRHNFGTPLARPPFPGQTTWKNKWKTSPKNTKHMPPPPHRTTKRKPTNTAFTTGNGNGGPSSRKDSKKNRLRPTTLSPPKHSPPSQNFRKTYPLPTPSFPQ